MVDQTSDLLSIARLSSTRKERLANGAHSKPLITSEWAVEIFKEGKMAGLKAAYVSNGNATPEVLRFIQPHVDYYKIDLKSFDDRHYRQLGGVLQNILDSIRLVHEMGFWLEIVTLVIPGFNDSKEEIKRLCDFIVSVSPDIPWHATAFHQDYKMQEPANTSAERLLEIAEIGRGAGLNFVYLGNLPGRVGNWENTYCPHCKKELIRRHGFRVLSNVISGSTCPSCAHEVPGVWE